MYSIIVLCVLIIGYIGGILAIFSEDGLIDLLLINLLIFFKLLEDAFLIDEYFVILDDFII